MTQKKPYICNNQNNCDVRIVIDMSGIKRKGARCQACRYTACLDAGMYHSGNFIFKYHTQKREIFEFHISLANYIGCI